mmetsp:Transcript_46669/g.117407  ORF Transcript_46669/g.117407 Transcript_46669/m.117407 type:complete len:278 (+) Transcript_46669:46-879(+)
MDYTSCDGSCQCRGGSFHCLRQWTSPHLRNRNTFLELAPPLVNSPLGVQVWRRQVSEPTFASSGLDMALRTPVQIQRLEEELLTGKGLDVHAVPSERQVKMATRGSSGRSSDAVAREPCSTEESSVVLQAPTPSAASSLAPVDMPTETADVRPVVQASDRSTPCDLPSRGSKLHSRRRCRPCAFVRSVAGCQDGAACKFCHMMHIGAEKMQVRPCKGKRDRHKKFIDKLARNLSTNPDAVDLDKLTFPQFIEQSPVRKASLLAKLSHHAAQARHPPA